jgi:hypothetical protein
MGEREDQKPNQQYSIVNNRAPQEKTAREFDAHFLASSSASNEKI